MLANRTRISIAKSETPQRRSSAASQRRKLPAAASRRRRRVRRLVVATCLLLTAVIGALPVYVRPQIDQPRHADAILILGGFGDSRYAC
jgi:hypothetical protein